MTSPNIRAVRADPNYRLTIEWADGSVTQHDLSEIVNTKTWATVLRDVAVFNLARVESNGREVIWPNTDIEFSADGLWEDVHPPLVRAPRWMSPADFRSWLTEMNFTWDQASAELGVSRRTVANYCKGTQEIPKAIWLACMQLASAKARDTKPAAAAAPVQRENYFEWKIIQASTSVLKPGTLTDVRSMITLSQSARVFTDSRPKQPMISEGFYKRHA